jgi:hypothetical protein
MSAPAGRVLDAMLELADRQIVDLHGRRAGKVDDLDLELDDEGRLWVTGLRSGPGALAPRLGGSVARAWARLSARLSPGDDPDETRISLGVVSEIGLQVRLSVPAESLATERSERAVRELFIRQLPGADRAVE